MNSLKVAITASLLLAAIPLAGASHVACINPPANETIPLGNGQYVYVPTTAETATKIGLWQETNGRSHLQVSTCLENPSDAGSIHYRADMAMTPLP